MGTISIHLGNAPEVILPTVKIISWNAFIYEEECQTWPEVRIFGLNHVPYNECLGQHLANMPKLEAISLPFVHEKLDVILNAIPNIRVLECICEPDEPLPSSD